MRVRGLDPGIPFRYWLFLNDERTRMLTAWPGIDKFQPGMRWTLESATRRGDGGWGPPAEDLFVGDWFALSKHAEDEGYTLAEAVR